MGMDCCYYILQSPHLALFQFLDDKEYSVNYFQTRQMSMNVITTDYVSNLSQRQTMYLQYAKQLD
jgi:hypothetical protein